MNRWEVTPSSEAMEMDQLGNTTISSIHDNGDLCAYLNNNPAVGEGTPKPKLKRTYNTSGLRKKKRKFIRTQKSHKKQSSIDLDPIRV